MPSVFKPRRVTFPEWWKWRSPTSQSSFVKERLDDLFMCVSGFRIYVLLPNWLISWWVHVDSVACGERWSVCLHPSRRSSLTNDVCRVVLIPIVFSFSPQWTHDWLWIPTTPETYTPTSGWPWETPQGNYTQAGSGPGGGPLLHAQE